MTVTMLDRAAVSADPGRVDEERRPDPEVPEKARRRTFTAAYKARILAAYDGAAQGEKGAICGGRACTPVTSSTGGGPRPGTTLSIKPGNAYQMRNSGQQHP